MKYVTSQQIKHFRAMLRDRQSITPWTREVFENKPEYSQLPREYVEQRKREARETIRAPARVGPAGSTVIVGRFRMSDWDANFMFAAVNIAAGLLKELEEIEKSDQPSLF